jgi:raffinose/stachyose/melibiose transport system substrate-binding protein
MRNEKMVNELEYIQELLTSVWPEWKVTKRLGKGTYGAVYEIVRNDLGSNYQCALKVLQMRADETSPDNTANTADFRTEYIYGSPYRPLSMSGAGTATLEDFVRNVSEEINMMIQLKGVPGIVAIEDYAVLRGNGIRTILIRMEELESLDHYFSRTGYVSKEDVIRLGTQICSALSVCERSNILHRDIKPGNLFYSDLAGFKLGDFGISRKMDSIHERMAMSGVGTLQYMAPEVYQGREYNNTVDIYSLGIVLYMLMNRSVPPLYPEDEIRDSTGSGWNRAALNSANMRRLRGEKLPPPSMADPGLAAVICRACDPDPEKRYQTADSFRLDLQRCVDPGAREKPFVTPVTPASGKARGNAFGKVQGNAPGKLAGWALPAVAAVLVVLVAVAGAFLAGRSSGKKGSSTDSQAVAVENKAAQFETNPESTGETGTEQTGTEQTGTEQAGTEQAENGREISEQKETGQESAEQEVKEQTETEQTAEEQVSPSIAYNTDGRIRIFCKKYESSLFQRLIDSFSKESGIEVTAMIAGKGNYNSKLEENLDNGTDAPTLFMLSGAKDFEQYGASCLDLSDSAAVQELDGSTPALKGSDGKTYGLPCLVEAYGLTVNTRLLEKAGYTLSDLTSFDDLKRIAEDISSRKAELGFAAFTAPSIGSGVSGSYRFSEHAPAVPLYYELKDHDFNVGTALQSTYMDQFKAFVDLYINNCTISGQKLSGHALAESQQEFLDEKAVFHQDGSWDYDDLRGILDGNAAVIPMYMGIPGESAQGINQTCSYFWCVNKSASADDQEAALQFLQWLTTSEKALSIMTRDMGFSVPYQKANAPDNLYLDTLQEEKAAGKETVLQYYKYGDYTAWVDAIDHAIEDYVNGSASWDSVRKAFVSLW